MLKLTITTLGGRTFTAVITNSILVPKNTTDFPGTALIGNVNFPTTLNQTVTVPASNYTNNEYYFVTKDPAYNSIKNTTNTQNIFIPYLGQSFDCFVVDSLVDSASSLTYPKIPIAANHTVFLDSAMFWPTQNKGNITYFSYQSLKVVGAHTNKESVIGPNYNDKSGNKGHMKYQFQTKDILMENLVFDGQNMQFYGNNNAGSNYKNNYYFIQIQEGTSSADNLIFRNIKFRNIGNGTEIGIDRGVFNFNSDAANRNYNLKRYFENITLESAKFSSFYAPVNINRSDGIFFKNFNMIQTGGGQQYSIHISDADGSNPGSQNIVFDGLTMPKNNGIEILHYSSRGLSFPETYRYLHMRTNWVPTINGQSGASHAIIMKEDYAYDANRVVFDAKDSVFIVSSKYDITQQLNNIKTLLTSSAIKAATALPNPTIKIIKDDNGEIGGFTIPDFSGVNGTAHLIIVDSLKAGITQLEKLIPYSGATITFPGSGNTADKYKLYNVDFTQYSPNKDSLTIPKIGEELPNAIEGNFYNCLFKTYEEREPYLRVEGERNTPTIYLKVTLPEIDFKCVTMDPGPGDYYVKERECMTFSLIVDECCVRPYPFIPIVKANGKEVSMVGEPVFSEANMTTTYTFLVCNDSKPVLVTIEENIPENPKENPTGIEASTTGSRIWAAGQQIHMLSQKSQSARIYNLFGQLKKQMIIGEGEEVVTLPSGIYLVVLEDGTRQKVNIK